MKLQKQVAYKYKDKTHYKYVLVIPQKMILELGWTDGQELKLSTKNSVLKIEKEII